MARASSGISAMMKVSSAVSPPTGNNNRVSLLWGHMASTCPGRIEMFQGGTNTRGTDARYAGVEL